MLRNDSARDPEPLEEGQLEEEPFGDDQVWAAVLAQEEQRHAEVIRQWAKYHGMSPSTNSRDEEEVERMLQDTQARMERLFLEPDERHLPVRKPAKQPHRQGEPSTVHVSFEQVKSRILRNEGSPEHDWSHVISEPQHSVKSTQYGRGTVTEETKMSHPEWSFISELRLEQSGTAGDLEDQKGDAPIVTCPMYGQRPVRE
ncbi:hypothetical protein BJY52DRAFT_1226412 [Lactarius psammicola]|nr:hypothetical protein BJY52DRAFT_1226412 [Lactarius psammicola]